LGLNGIHNRTKELLNRGLKNGASLNKLVRVTGLSRRTISRQKKKKILEKELKLPRLF
jgi:DNA invertase Pin-like site-specific DNA recombinase